MNKLSMIAAVSRNWGLGKDGDLLFHIKGDMKFFREKTMNSVVVMGRKTLDSFPGGKPLKNRENIVITGNMSFEREGAVIVHSIEELFEKLSEYEDRNVIVIGGGEIYAMFLPYCDCAYITKIDAEAEADTFLHNFDEDSLWRVAEESEQIEENGTIYRFVTYRRTED